MDISPIKKVTVTLLSLAIMSCVTAKGTSTPAINFKLMAGAGKLIEKNPEEDTVKQLDQVTLSLIDNITIRQEPIDNITTGQESNCRGLSLDTQTETLVVVGDCPSDQYFVCPGGSESCTTKSLDQTQRNDHVYEYESNFTGLNYVVELYSNKMIYRIQESNCIIPYPHGCLLKAPGWKDVEYFEFIKY